MRVYPLRRAARARATARQAGHDRHVPVILVVDDDRAICELVSEFLESLGYSVLTARTGTDALAALRQARPDLVITDISMPEMDGVELCEALEERPETARIPRVIMSAWPSPVARDLAGGRAHAFLSKPFDLERLERVVLRLLPMP